MNKIRNWEDLIAVMLSRCYDDGAWVQVISKKPWFRGIDIRYRWSPRQDDKLRGEIFRVCRLETKNGKRNHYYQLVRPKNIREPFKKHLKHNKIYATSPTQLHGRFLVPVSLSTPPKILEVCIRNGQIK